MLGLQDLEAALTLLRCSLQPKHGWHRSHTATVAQWRAFRSSVEALRGPIVLLFPGLSSRLHSPVARELLHGRLMRAGRLSYAKSEKHFQPGDRSRCRPFAPAP